MFIMLIIIYTISCSCTSISYDSTFLCDFEGGKTREVFLEEVGMYPAGFSEASEQNQNLTFCAATDFLDLCSSHRICLHIF